MASCRFLGRENCVTGEMSGVIGDAAMSVTLATGSLIEALMSPMVYDGAASTGSA